MNDKYEEQYYITCQTTKILLEEHNFDDVKLGLENIYGIFNSGDIVSIHTLLEAYNDLYEKFLGSDK